MLYDVLFKAASQTLLQIAADPKHLGAQIGFLGILHTWGQNLLHHPHAHFVVPGGCLAPERSQWVACRDGFFLPSDAGRGPAQFNRFFPEASSKHLVSCC